MTYGLGLLISDDHAATLERSEQTPAKFAVSSDELSKLPREWHTDIPVRNQGSFSCCVGGGLSGCFEHSNLVETGEFIRRSMWQAYISSQRACGMAGSDQGASLSGALKAAGDVGVCLDSLCPMPTRYATGIPEAALADAKKHKHLTQTWDARLWDKAVDWATNRNAILIGGLWTDRHSSINAQNPIEKPSVYSGLSRGYHCRRVCGYIFIDGKLYLQVQNTHGKTFGLNGISYIGEDTWAVLDRDPNFVSLIVGDTEEIEPTRKSWSESSPGDVC